MDSSFSRFFKGRNDEKLSMQKIGGGWGKVGTSKLASGKAVI